jgi:hypothetical protein
MVTVLFSDDGLAAMGALPPSTAWNIPSLNHLCGRNVLNAALDRLTGQALRGVDDPHDRLQCLNLVRLTDLSIRSFEQGRALLSDYAANGNDGKVSPFFDAVDAFETTVIAAYRATRAAKELRVGHPAVVMPRTATVEELKGLRDAIVHVDGRIRSAARGDGRMILHMLYPVEEGVIIDRRDSMTYMDLAAAITTMFGNVETLRGAPSV